MRCHEVLGIDERATVSDIMLAYDNKKSFLNGDIPASAEQIQAKLHELNSAKDDCIAWASMNFASKTAKRVDEYSSNCFSQNRLNEVCIGPCTCTDVCGGMLVALGSLILGLSDHATFPHRLQHGHNKQVVCTLGLRHSNHDVIPPKYEYELIPQK